MAGWKITILIGDTPSNNVCSAIVMLVFRGVGATKIGGPPNLWNPQNALIYCFLLCFHKIRIDFHKIFPAQTDKKPMRWMFPSLRNFKLVFMNQNISAILNKKHNSPGLVFSCHFSCIPNESNQIISWKQVPWTWTRQQNSVWKALTSCMARSRLFRMAFSLCFRIHTKPNHVSCYVALTPKINTCVLTLFGLVSPSWHWAITYKI